MLSYELFHPILEEQVVLGILIVSQDIFCFSDGTVQVALNLNGVKMKLYFILLFKRTVFEDKLIVVWLRRQ